MRWFGKSWGAPICHSTPHAATPVGEACQFCRNPIEAGDQGFLLPFLSEGVEGELPSHRKCLLRAVLGPSYPKMTL